MQLLYNDNYNYFLLIIMTIVIFIIQDPQALVRGMANGPKEYHSVREGAFVQIRSTKILSDKHTPSSRSVPIIATAGSSNRPEATHRARARSSTGNASSLCQLDRESYKQRVAGIAPARRLTHIR